jgi:hypothetical protein
MSTREAKELYTLLSDKELRELKNRMNTGGNNNG